MHVASKLKPLHIRSGGAEWASISGENGGDGAFRVELSDSFRHHFYELGRDAWFWTILLVQKPKGTDNRVKSAVFWPSVERNEIRAGMLQSAARMLLLAGS